MKLDIGVWITLFAISSYNPSMLVPGNCSKEVWNKIMVFTLVAHKKSFFEFSIIFSLYYIITFKEELAHKKWFSISLKELRFRTSHLLILTYSIYRN